VDLTNLRAAVAPAPNIACIGHFHIAGNPDRGNIDDNQEINYRGVSIRTQSAAR
jgi:hydroxypyruvate isomerase